MVAGDPLSAVKEALTAYIRVVPSSLSMAMGAEALRLITEKGEEAELLLSNNHDQLPPTKSQRDELKWFRHRGYVDSREDASSILKEYRNRYGKPPWKR